MLTGGLLAAPAGLAAQSDHYSPDAPRTNDPRVKLKPGYDNAGTAIENLKFVVHEPIIASFYDSATAGKNEFVNADMAFKGNYIFQGNYYGFQVWDISNPKKPILRTSFVCPGGQGDPSVYHNLLFISVEETSGRLDCGRQGVTDTVSTERFRGVRIFDISDLDHPKQVAAVQTCRGSHTHTLVTDPNDEQNVYIYVSGTSVVRSGNELGGCSGKRPEEDPNTSLFRIEVIKVPVASPQDAKIVNQPRLFADSAGNIAGLWKGGNHGEGTQTTAETDMCHDITTFQAAGIAAGACSGNGILLDIRDPANPKRIAEVTDPNFSYWHSATFNNDATKVLYTDEWGGGSLPRHHGAGLVSRRALGLRLYRCSPSGRDRLFRSRPVGRAEVGRGGRLLVRLLVQRLHRGVRDHAWPRSARAQVQRQAVQERDRGRQAGEARSVQSAGAAEARMAGELLRCPGVHRSARAEPGTQQGSVVAGQERAEERREEERNRAG
jgi:hypothetical protein